MPVAGIDLVISHVPKRCNGIVITDISLHVVIVETGLLRMDKWREITYSLTLFIIVREGLARGILLCIHSNRLLKLSLLAGFDIACTSLPSSSKKLPSKSMRIPIPSSYLASWSTIITRCPLSSNHLRPNESTAGSTRCKRSSGFLFPFAAVITSDVSCR